MIRWFGSPAEAILGESVDLSESTRRQTIREAEYQQAADAECRILRVSGKSKPKGEPIPAIRERLR